MQRKGVAVWTYEFNDALYRVEFVAPGASLNVRAAPNGFTGDVPFDIGAPIASISATSLAELLHELRAEYDKVLAALRERSERIEKTGPSPESTTSAPESSDS